MEYNSLQDTLDHKKRVEEYLSSVVTELQHRALVHDASKLQGIEKETLDKFVPQLNMLASSEYNDEKYKNIMASMKIGNDSHYANNRHHPEHFNNGVNEMTLVDIIEMIYDWKAACDRKNIDIMKTINSNFERFGITEQLAQIILNTFNNEFKYHVTYKYKETEKCFKGNSTFEIRSAMNKLINVVPEQHLNIMKYGPNMEYIEDYNSIRNSSTYIDNDLSIIWEVKK